MKKILKLNWKKLKKISDRKLKSSDRFYIYSSKFKKFSPCFFSFLIYLTHDLNIGIDLNILS